MATFMLLVGPRGQQGSHLERGAAPPAPAGRVGGKSGVTPLFLQLYESIRNIPINASWGCNEPESVLIVN